MDEFSTYVDTLLEKSGKPIICGDFNIHVENPNDSTAQSFISLYQSKGFLQHVNCPTHHSGGTLDLILTCANVASQTEINNLKLLETLELCLIIIFFVLMCHVCFHAIKRNNLKQKISRNGRKLT